MGEITFRSAGVSTREIDLSQPTSRGPTGVPAGIIGTSQKGPAFVPLTFGSSADFVMAFGDGIDDNQQGIGYVAVEQWLANAGSCTYLRVLGVGDGKKRSSSTGNVTNAGFVVGSKEIQNSGLVGDSIYSNAGVGSVEGRTYFLGCFMSESNGNTIFSETGIQKTTAAVPILRGVLLAPSGVVIHMGAKDQTAPSATLTARATSTTGMGRKGHITGSVDLKGGNQEFTLVLNGHKGSTDYPNLISGSFDVASGQYISKVFNTKPSRIEEAGHLLYSHFDIHPNLAITTGSGAIQAALGSEESIGFLLTSSVARVGKGSGALSANVPVYESFEDRFTTPKTPFITSQGYGATPYNLFRLHSVDDGSFAAGKYKISIKNLKKSMSDTDQYGIFDLMLEI